MRPFNEHTFPGERVIVSYLSQAPLRVPAFPAGFFEHLKGQIGFKRELPYRRSISEPPKEKAIPAGDARGV
jgi:hypothetical protein